MILIILLGGLVMAYQIEQPKHIDCFGKPKCETYTPKIPKK